MLQYEKSDVSEGNDINKTNASKKCMLCYYWYFKVGLSPFKNDEKCFLFHLKSSFLTQDI